MIKLYKLPDQVMDVIMELSREHHLKPDEIIKIMLSLVSKNEAKKAIEYEQNMQGRK